MGEVKNKNILFRIGKAVVPGNNVLDFRAWHYSCAYINDMCVSRANIESPYVIRDPCLCVIVAFFGVFDSN